MATKTTIEVPVEEQNVMTEIEQTNNEETTIACDAVPANKEAILAQLAEKVEEEPSAELRSEVEALKVAFYKLHRADMDSRRKAFFEENGADAEYKPQTDEAEVRFKELYSIYRTKRDEATALSDKEKEENYNAKLSIIEELKQLVDSEEALNTTFAKFHDLQARWRAIGQVPQTKVSDLYETYNLHIENFYDYVKINGEIVYRAETEITVYNEWHTATINGIEFKTCDGNEHFIYGKWDMIIAFPPCTYLSNAGACRMFPKKGQIDENRFAKAMEAKAMFMAFYNADCERICIENPVPLSVVGLPEKTQVIQPYEYGHPYTKKTYLWLKGLPKLKPTNIVEPVGPYVCGNFEIWKKQASKGIVYGKEKSAKHRSKYKFGIKPRTK